MPKKEEDYTEEKEDLDNEIRSNVSLIPNNEGEPKFKLVLTPDKCVIFRSDELMIRPCIASLTVTNNTGKRQALKIKCTHKDIFRGNPAATFVEPKATVKIQISCCLNGETKLENPCIELSHITAEDTTKTPLGAWTPDSKPEGVRKLACLLFHSNNEPYFTANRNVPEARKADRGTETTPVDDELPDDLGELKSLMIELLKKYIEKQEKIKTLTAELTTELAIWKGFKSG